MLRLRFVLALAVPAALHLLPVLGTMDTFGLTAALAGTLAVLLLAATVLAVRDVAAAPVHVRRIALLERARRAAFLRLRDPDAEGHARPRAPSAAPAAA